MKGLHQEIAELREWIAREWVTARSIHSDPRDAHEAEARAKEHERKLAIACEAAHLGEAQFARLAEAEQKLRQSPRNSPELTLAIRDLETAAFRLRQHLGTAPTVHAG
jgi:hypothetical protein